MGAVNAENLREDAIKLQVNLHKLRQQRRYLDNKTLEQVVTDLARVRRGLEAVAFCNAQ